MQPFAPRNVLVLLSEFSELAMSGGKAAELSHFYAIIKEVSSRIGILFMALPPIGGSDSDTRGSVDVAKKKWCQRDALLY